MLSAHCQHNILVPILLWHTECVLLLVSSIWVTYQTRQPWDIWDMASHSQQTSSIKVPVSSNSSLVTNNCKCWVTNYMLGDSPSWWQSSKIPLGAWLLQGDDALYVFIMQKRLALITSLWVFFSSFLFLLPPFSLLFIIVYYDQSAVHTLPAYPTSLLGNSSAWWQSSKIPLVVWLLQGDDALGVFSIVWHLL